MSEETTKESTDNTADVVVEEEGKQTNRMFTQSELDKAIADSNKKLAGQYEDYPDIKKQLDEVQNRLKEKEMAEMTELEKQKKLVDELTNKSTELEQINKTLEIGALKANVLGDPEFSMLPRAYRDSIQGNSQDELYESARKVKEEYETDFKRTSADAGSPHIGKETKPVGPVTTGSFAERLNAKMKEKFV